MKECMLEIDPQHRGRFFDVLNNEFDRAVKCFSNNTIHFINSPNWVFQKWFTGLIIRPSNVEITKI